MREILQKTITQWLDDPDSAVVYAEQVDDRWAVRLTQETRDATTVWFWPRDRSLEFEAYFMPVGPEGCLVLRQALTRNARSWRAFFALDSDGGLVLRGRLAAAEVTVENLDYALGEIVETVEIAFRPMLEAVLADRENSV